MHFLRNNNKKSKYYNVKFFNVYLTLCMYRNSFFKILVCNSNLALLRQKFGKNSSSLEYYRRPRFIIAGVLSETQIHHHWSTIGDPDSSSVEYYRRPRFIIGVPYSPSKAPIHSWRHLFIIRPPYTSSETLIGHRRPTQFYRIPFEFHWRTSFITGGLSNFIGDHVCPIGVEPLIIIGDIIYIYFYWYSKKDVRSPMKSKLVNNKR